MIGQGRQREGRCAVCFHAKSHIGASTQCTSSSNYPQALASDGGEGPSYIDPPKVTTPKTAGLSSWEPSRSSSAILGELYVMPEKEMGSSGVGVQNTKQGFQT